jgi:hypothetical protein
MARITAGNPEGPGSALAFECYNASRSDQGNAHAAKSPALQSLSEVLADPEIVGLCPEGVEHVLAGLEDEGYRTDQVINFRTLMAGGLEKNGQPQGEELLHDGKGIDHLGEEFFATVDPLIGEGFGICFGP